ncbi:MAG: hypothetical protein WA188_14320 [Terriglobales bacterium]
MKLPLKVPCVCGHTVSFSTYGDEALPRVTCPECGFSTDVIDPLSVSVTGERLLYRSKAELEDGDYSLSIMIGAIAVESFLTRLFLKLKGMDSYATTFTLPTPVQEEAWEREYPRSGGFTGPADFVSKAITGMAFDEFVSGNTVAVKIMAGLPDAPHPSAKQYFQDELFKRRNRIVHWGYVNSAKAEAQLCHTLAMAAVSILREMDKSKYGAL